MEGKKKSDLFYILFCGLFGFIGIILSVTGILIFRHNQKFYETAMPATAKIIDFKRDNLDDSAHTIVEYTANGKIFRGELNYYSTGMKYGDRLSIYYNPQNPLDIKTKESSLLLLAIFIFMGMIFTGIGLGVGIYMYHQKSKISRLKQRGTRILAEIVELQENTNLSMNSSHPLIVTCRYVAPNGKVYFFTNKSVWLKTEELPTGSKIPVFIDKNNPSNYYVEVYEITHAGTNPLP